MVGIVVEDDESPHPRGVGMIPRWSGVLSVARSTKAERAHLLNLSSNELHHPALPGVLRECGQDAFGPERIRRYPVYGAVQARVAAHHGVVSAVIDQEGRVVALPDDRADALVFAVAVASR